MDVINENEIIADILESKTPLFTITDEGGVSHKLYFDNTFEGNKDWVRINFATPTIQSLLLSLNQKSKARVEPSVTFNCERSGVTQDVAE